MPFIKLIILIFIFSMGLNSFAKLPELKTKQALDNIRLISHDGKYTYYQQRSGDLQMSTNYDNKMIIKGQRGTYYLLGSTEARKKITIEILKNYHKRANFYALNEIHIMGYGKTTPTKIADGQNPKLHLGDKWLTYFHPRSKKIYMQNLFSKSKPIDLQLQNSINPYFLPEVLMPSPNTILYTDINKDGYMAIQMYSLLDKKFTVLYKSKFSGMRLDFCKVGEDLYLGEFSYDGINRGSNIIKVPLYNNKNFQNFSTIYASEMADIGHLVCTKDHLYFIKTTEYNKKINSRKSEAVELDLSSNKIKILSELGHATNIINMDGTILIPFREKYYVAKGLNELNKDSLEKEK